MDQQDQVALRAFVERRHPHYGGMLAHWNFLEETYKGGREWFNANIFRYIKEGDKEYNDRVSRAYRFNHTRETVDLVQKYLFKMPVDRNHEDVPEEIERMWKLTTLGGLDIDQFMRLVGQLSSIFGRIWVFTDTNNKGDVQTKEDEKKGKSRFYAYTVRPQDVLDFAWSDEDGELLWILVRETYRDDKDWMHSTGEVRVRYRLWTRSEWILFGERAANNGDKTIHLENRGPNSIGRVPCYPVDHMIGENKYVSPALINDIAYLDRAVANYLSNLDAIIQDQTFSQLAMPAQGLLPGDKEFDQLVEMGTKRIFVYDGEGGTEPKFISPDPRQAQIIVTVINKIINEIYHTIGMAGERTKEDNAVGIDNSSGVAKAYDFERVNALLTSKAQGLENAENKLIELCMLWHGKAPPEEEFVSYPETFDVRGLFDEFAIAETLATIEAPVEVRRVQMEAIVEKLFPRLSDALKTKIKADIDGWLEGVEPGLSQMPPSKFETDKSLNPTPRQGQVTKDTGSKKPKAA